MSLSLLAVVGLNHRTAPIALRERLAFTEDTLPGALDQLQRVCAEACILSTCNRTEIYAVLASASAGVELSRCLAEQHQVAPADLEGHLYERSDEDAVRHLLQVACGLDSMVLGEAQILGQVRGALELATAAGSVGPVLARVFSLAIETGKRARTSTRIGRGLVSPSSVAVDLAKRALGDLHAKSVLVIGAGDAAQTTVRSLVDAGVTTIRVVNRSHSHAVEAAAAVGGLAVPFDDLVPQLVDADIVISSTGATQHVITLHDVQGAMAQRQARPLLCVDIAVPRDIDPAVATVPGVHLYNIDDLQAVSAANLHDRQLEVAAVESVVDDGVADYLTWRSVQTVVPTISALYQRAESIRRLEVERTIPRLNGLPDDQREMIDLMTAAIVRRILHEPVSTLRERSRHPDGEYLTQSVRRLFALDPVSSENGIETHPQNVERR